MSWENLGRAHLHLISAQTFTLTPSPARFIHPKMTPLLSNLILTAFSQCFLFSEEKIILLFALTWRLLLHSSPSDLVDSWRLFHRLNIFWAPKLYDEFKIQSLNVMKFKFEKIWKSFEFLATKHDYADFAHYKL